MSANMATKEMYRSTSSDSTSLKRTQSYQFPNAHYNHLTGEQNEKLEQFKKLSQDKGYYKPAGPDRSRASHDDETLLRYLRARKFVPVEAFKQFKDTEDWRNDNEINKLYDTIDIEEFDETRRLVSARYAAPASSSCLKHVHSTLNGPVGETNEVSLFMSLRSQA